MRLLSWDLQIIGEVLRAVRGIRVDTVSTFRDQFITFSNSTTLTTTQQSRRGIQYKVGESFDSVNLGSSVVSTEVIHTMRSRNVEFIARRLKPKTRLYAFFDNVDMNKYIVPKLIEVQMESGTFIIGETVVGTVGTTSIRFRLSTPNHKYGPYNKPEQVYVENPYVPGQSIPVLYSTTSNLLNVDTYFSRIASVLWILWPHNYKYAIKGRNF
jgi:hypothetical protein